MAPASWRRFRITVGRGVLFFAPIMVAGLVACRSPGPAEAAPAGAPGRPSNTLNLHPSEVAGLSCRSMMVEGRSSSEDSLTWWTFGSGNEQEPWCRGVGPALAIRQDPSPALPPSLSDVAFLSWNVYAGGGDVDALIRDLKEGVLDGQPTRDFVLFLQEVFRAGPPVPSPVDPGSKWAGRIAEGDGARGERSIDEVARRNGLHLLYVPSMRNGGREDPPEDRGNAILSTLPLEDAKALELPLERQRRVAISANVIVGGPDGESLRVRLVNLHLDPRSRWKRFYRSFGAGRAHQVRAVVGRFAEDPVVVLGGDLNTWFGGRREGAVEILDDAFPRSKRRGEAQTITNPGPLPDLVLDYIFFRPPQGMSGTYQVVGSRYGSDHHPVVGRILPDGGRTGEGGKEHFPGGGA